MVIIAGVIKPTSMALSLTKGFEIAEDGRIELISQVIRRHLNVSNGNDYIIQNIKFIFYMYVDSLCSLNGCKFSN